jgi:PBP1b-binding outer membrane lipoprotein LpoB
MKNKYALLLLMLLSLLIINGCSKKSDPLPVIKPVAKAPADTTITLPTNSLTLKGSGSDASGTIVGYLWSQVSGPGEATIVNEGSATATMKGLIAGKYLFQFSVTDNKGLTGLDTVFVTVKPAVIITLSLSPANNVYETPLTLFDNSQDESDHTSIEEPLAAWTIGGSPVVSRNLLQFDLSSIPSNATILTADLYLYSDTIPKNGDLIHANYGADNSVMIQQVATAWNPATTAWFNQPSGLTANQIVIPSTTLPFLNLDVNVKAMVGSMVSGNANYGFKLSLVNEVEFTSRIFCSSYYSDASRHPKLLITYEKN